MKTQAVILITMMAVAFASPVPEEVKPDSKAVPAEADAKLKEGDAKEEVEGRFFGGFGGGAGGFNRGYQFGQGAAGNYGNQNQFAYNRGQSSSSEYGNTERYGHRENFGLSHNAGQSASKGQNSYGNQFNQGQYVQGGNRFGQGFGGFGR